MIYEENMNSDDLQNLVEKLEVNDISLIWPAQWDVVSDKTGNLLKRNLFDLLGNVTVDDLYNKFNIGLDSFPEDNLLKKSKNEIIYKKNNNKKKNISKIIEKCERKVVCNEPKCNSSPAYNFDGHPKHLYCQNCALPGMINIARKKCQHGRKNKCKNSDVCRFIATHGFDVPMACIRHKTNKMKEIIKLNPK